MQVSSFQAISEDRGLVLDPRTKLLAVLTMALFVLGGIPLAGAGSVLIPCLCMVPLALLLSAKKWKAAAIYVALYAIAYTLMLLVLPHVTGILNFIVLGSTGILTRFLPTMTMGVYLLTTTTVSELTAAMQRMHVNEKIIIPLSVMFRFFPTLADECSSINTAMKMRGISFAGGNPAAMLEYRVVPMMFCSIKIGEELSAAALTRGLGGDVRRTNVCAIGFKVQDVIVFALCAGLYAFAIYARIAQIAGVA